LRIAQIAPLAEPVPPRLYGGTERVVSWLTEELVRTGHRVTLFASGDSVTRAALVACAPQAFRLAGVRDQTASLLVMLDEVRRRADQFDILHFHIDLFQFPIFRELFDKCVTTLHGRLDLPDIHPIYRAFPEMPLVSISDSQRRPMPPVNWLRTIHHGLPHDLYRFNPDGGDYLAFLGRISPEKRPDRAIEIAKRSGVPLKIAAKVDQVDQKYFATEIEPLLDHPLIEYIGEIDDRRKGEFLGGARALLIPIDWPEPFGLVVIEAMATGTPIIAWKEGSVPEILDHGQSGLIVDTLDAAVEAVEQVGRLDRRGVRDRFDRRFTVSRMAASYVEAYETVPDAVVGGPDLQIDDVLAVSDERIRAPAPLLPLTGRLSEIGEMRSKPGKPLPQPV
jgi:glycosyltransferase involved in cell wall biosynthesis